eukprot:TRINITY_DN23704_c0_g1_i1.p1 TRINITY_DN23704_c0_g1~~TRINITY_DN23704_c0_g1_i1.p1  ORF type:complete len:394 (+),score=40.48 TRINITY_DN23704_c0_g1_i1:67-1182(+)
MPGENSPNLAHRGSKGIVRAGDGHTGANLNGSTEGGQKTGCTANIFCSAAATLALFVGLAYFVYSSQLSSSRGTLRASFQKDGAPSLRGSLDDDFPLPPPYTYTGFSEWFRQTKFEGRRSVKWVPDFAEYDVDAALKGKFGPWLSGEDAEAAVNVAKNINRYVFTSDMVRSGDMSTMASLGMHLYVLRRLRAAAAGRDHPTFIDAGCGTGYLLRGWTMLAGEGSRAIGFDLDGKLIESTRKHLDDPNAIDSAFHIPEDTMARAYRANALQPLPASVMEDISSDLADAMNIGFAVESTQQLSELAKLLRVGGKIAVPICQPPEKQPKDITVDKCAAQFRILSKTNEALEVVPDDPGVEVRFIVARQSSQNAS